VDPHQPFVAHLFAVRVVINTHHIAIVVIANFRLNGEVVGKGVGQGRIGRPAGVAVIAAVLAFPDVIG
jgi:hypothetical protein